MTIQLQPIQWKIQTPGKNEENIRVKQTTTGKYIIVQDVFYLNRSGCWGCGGGNNTDLWKTYEFDSLDEVTTVLSKPTTSSL